MAYRGGPRGGRDQNPRSREPRVNRRIRVRDVRVIGDDGTQLGILPTEEALRRAEELGLDLVEVSPTARPPVCKIMDYGRYKYQQKRKANEAKKNQHQIELKEVKFRPKTDKHDFEVKQKRIVRFIEQGNKCKVTIMFRGRENSHPEIGREILERVARMLKEIAQVEMAPRREGRVMFMILAPARGQKAKAQASNSQAGPAPTGAPQSKPTTNGPEITRVSSPRPSGPPKA